jgi:molecular chaperone DnaK
MGKIIGIDLGTAKSCIAIMEGGQPRVIPNAEGSNTTPSVVGFNLKTGERLVGAPAARQGISQPKNTVASIKRIMGLRYTDWGKEHRQVPYLLDRSVSAEVVTIEPPKPDLEMERRRVPYQIECGEKGECIVNIQGKRYSPEEISAMILMKMKDSAEVYLGEDVNQAVITVPAHFDVAQRQATKDAGAIAGLEVLRIINAPNAAALAYSLDKKKAGTIAVFDFGGGTFDISIVEVSEGVVEVKSINGDTHLGGDNVDEIIIDWLVEEFQNQEGIDLRNQVDAMQRLREVAEKAKCELSSTTQSEVNLPYITSTASGPKHITQTLTRGRFGAMIEPILEKLKVICENALKDARLSHREIEEVLLVGGSTRMPQVQELVKSIFQRDPINSVNPDEGIAMGAAVMGGILAGDIKGMLLLDVTPLSLGINANGGEMSTIIPRNTTIPTKRSDVYTTALDNQAGVEIEVFQGERPLVEGNKLLGNFHLSGLSPALRGKPQIEVTFDIDANSIMHVTAKDMGTGQDASITLTGSTGLSKDDIDAKVREAEAHKAEVGERKKLLETKNALDHAIYQVEKLIEENSDMLSEGDRKDAEGALTGGKKAMATMDATLIQRSLEAIIAKSHNLRKCK